MKSHLKLAWSKGLLAWGLLVCKHHFLICCLWPFDRSYCAHMSCACPRLAAQALWSSVFHFSFRHSLHIKNATSSSHGIGQWSGGRKSNNSFQRVWGGLLQEIFMGCLIVFGFLGCHCQQILQVGSLVEIGNPTKSRTCNADWIILASSQSQTVVTSSHRGTDSIDWFHSALLEYLVHHSFIPCFFCNGVVVNALKTCESVMFWRLPLEEAVERRQAGDMFGSFNLWCQHMPTELTALNMQSSLVSIFF